MLSKVIELSGVFLMMDMKAEVENTSIKMICKANIKDMCNMAEFYSCKKLSSACVKFIVEEGVDMKEEDVRQAPAIAAACLEAYKNFKHASEKRSASKSLKSKQDAAICWALNPTTAVNFSETGVYSKERAVNRLRKELEEEAEAERSADRKRRRPVVSRSRALEALMGVGGERGGRGRLQEEHRTSGVCPFCSRRCSLSPCFF